MELTEQERYLLTRGLRQWGGPADATDEVARVIGFTSVDELDEHAARIATALGAGQALTKPDWTAAVVATEIAFVSHSLLPADKRLSVEGATAALVARPSAVLLGCSGGSVGECFKQFGWSGCRGCRSGCPIRSRSSGRHRPSAGCGASRSRV